MVKRNRDAEVGLCAKCVFARVVTSDRGAEFYLCGRAETDARFVKYPRLPVRECVGFEGLREAQMSESKADREENQGIDLARCSFEEFVESVFTGGLREDTEESLQFWFGNPEWPRVAERLCGYYIRLFQAPEFLRTRFSKEHLEDGFWMIESQTAMWSVGSLLGERDLPVEMRADCIRSMFELFRWLFWNEALDTSVFMWWDALCYDWHCENRKRENGGEDRVLQDVFFETLEKILFLDSEICQQAALHGLGHLHHPDTDALVKRYLEAHPGLNEELREYAGKAAKFEVQ